MLLAMFSDRTKGLICAGIAGFTWSILSIAIKIALEHISSGTLVWFRFAVALSTLFLLISIFDRQQLRILKKWPFLAVVAGFFLSVNFLGYQKGVELTSPSNAQVLIQGAPLSLFLCGILFFKERPRPIQWAGLLLSFIGLGVFLDDQLQSSLQNKGEFLDGNLWLLVACVTWAAYASLQKVLTKKGWQPQEINLILYSIAFVVLFPLADLSEFQGHSLSTWLIFIYLGLNTVIAYGAMGIALKLAPASQVSVVVTTNPILTLIIMQILTWQKVTWIDPDQVSLNGYLGAIFVVAGVILAVSQSSKKAQK